MPLTAFSISVHLAALMLAACSGSGETPGSTIVPPPPPPAPDGKPVVAVDTTIRYQRITAWEATAEAGQNDIPSFPAYRDKLLDLATSYLGITRLRVEVRSGAENPVDNWALYSTGQITDAQWRCLRYATVNDNSDPTVINPAGFHFSELDATMDRLVIPMRNRLAASGERLLLNVNYVAFARQCSGTPYAHLGNPAEYAEFVLATYQHLKSRYGIVPDVWEVILEPDNTSGLWSGTDIGLAIVAAAARLEQAGFTPRFIVPSTMSMANAAPYFDAVVAVPGARKYVSELSYHRYRGVSDANLAAIADRARTSGVPSAMLEHIGSGPDDLYADLTAGGVSAWQQFTLAYTGGDDGSKYFVVGSGASPSVTPGSRTVLLRQYFRYVRPGAVRLRAASSDPTLQPVAFENTGGALAVVVRAPSASAFHVTGLPPGTYAASYATGSGGTGALPPVAIGAGGSVDVAIPAAGVLTVYRH